MRAFPRIFGPTVLVLLGLLTACSESPTGRRQLLLFSETSLAEMGAQEFAAARARSIPLADAALNDYIRCVATPLLEAQDGSWELAVFRDESNLNAFALPGNKIAIYTGLLQAAREPDQLAAVIGHEIGHVLARHANERASGQVATEMGLALFYEIWSGGSGGPPSDRARILLGTGASVGVLLPFSRAHESEADLIGLRLMADAGFDPRHSVTLWENMAAVSARDNSPEFLSTHPSHESRSLHLQERMPEALARFEAARTKAPARNCNADQPRTPAAGPATSPGAGPQAAPPSVACCDGWQWW